MGEDMLPIAMCEVSVAIFIDVSVAIFEESEADWFEVPELQEAAPIKRATAISLIVCIYYFLR
jgi:hypothetical protein